MTGQMHSALCECNDPHCSRIVKISSDEYTQKLAPEDIVIIADGCQPSDGDVFFEKREGYTLYKDTSHCK